MRTSASHDIGEVVFVDEVARARRTALVDQDQLRGPSRHLPPHRLEDLASLMPKSTKRPSHVPMKALDGMRAHAAPDGTQFLKGPPCALGCQSGRRRELSRCPRRLLDGWHAVLAETKASRSQAGLGHRLHQQADEAPWVHAVHSRQRFDRADQRFGPAGSEDRQGRGVDDLS
jgi:hypothetical protein